MTEPWEAARARLRDEAVPDEAVILPGDVGLAWEGALHVSSTPAGVWTISTVDYGQPRLLLRRPSAEEAVAALYAYLLGPLPPASSIADDERERMLAWAAPHILDLAGRAGNRTFIDAPAGLLLDRIGALDGYLLFPTGTSFEARSLPPTALGQPLHSFVTTDALRVEASVTPPWFGRQGGGVRFAIAEAGVGIRDLVREGRLARLD
ncbi:TNT domain-containing protein [Microbacterium sp. BWT-B31]|uniref:TNT domain-containing protein n=1 Tax=Microbacterium sp. BWT-B31 TaxID=3232072 RepID=UPI003527559D